MTDEYFTTSDQYYVNTEARLDTILDTQSSTAWRMIVAARKYFEQRGLSLWVLSDTQEVVQVINEIGALESGFWQWLEAMWGIKIETCLLYTSPSPRD